MKKYFYLLLLLFFFNHPVFPQKIDGPDGNPLYSLIIFEEGDVICKVVSTQLIVYSSKYSKTTGWSKAKVLFDFRKAKLFRNNLETGNQRTIYILSLDLTITEFRYDLLKDTLIGGPVIKAPPPIPLKSSQYSKLIVENGYFLFSDENNSIFVDLNDGKGWQLDSAGLSKEYPNDICVGNDRVLLVGTGRGLFSKKIGSGEKYQRINSMDSGNCNSVFKDKEETIHINISTGKYLYGNYWSSDNGSSWTIDTLGCPKKSVRQFAQDKSGTIYMLINDMFQIYRKLPDTKWERIDANYNPIIVIPTLMIAAGTTLEAIGNYGSFTSTDKGLAWFKSDFGIKSEQINIVFMLNNDTIIAKTSFGIYLKTKKEDGWKEILAHTSSMGYINSVYMDKFNNLYFVDNNINNSYRDFGNLYKSSDLGKTWIADTGGRENLPKQRIRFNLGTNGNQYIYCNLQDSNKYSFLFYSRETGKSWQIDTSGFNLSPSDQAYSNISFYDVPNFMYLSLSKTIDDTTNTNFLFKKPIKGGNWQLDTAGLNNKLITSIATSKDGKVYAGASSYYSSSIFSTVLIYKNGKWLSLPTLPANTKDISCFGLDSTGRLYSSYYYMSENQQKVYSTIDEGTTWQDASIYGKSFLGFCAYKDSMYAYTNREIYKLNNLPLKLPKISIVPRVIDFGQVQSKKQKDTAITIYNNGDDTLKISSIHNRLMQQSYSVYQEKLFVNPKDSVTIKLTFIPYSTSKYPYTFEVNSNDYPDSIVVTGEGILTDNSPNLKVSLDSINFGTVMQGNNKDTIVTLENTGKDTLWLYHVSSSIGNYWVNELPGYILPDGKEDIIVTFQPYGNKVYDDTINIISNVAPISIKVFGISTAHYLQLENDTIDFGRVKKYYSIDTIITIQNQSADTLFIKNLIFSSSTFSTYSEKFSIMPYSSSQLWMTFTPTEVKKYDDYVFIDCNDIFPDTIFLKGEGFDKVSVDEESVDKYSHCQIYPNPVIDNLWLQFTLNSTSDVSISIFNTLGLEIKRIEANALLGKSSINISTKEFSSGMYYCTLSSKGSRITKSFVVIK